MLEDEFEEEFSNGKYINKLEKLIYKYGDFDNSLKINRLTEEEKRTLDMLKYLYEKLELYFNLKCIYLKEEFTYYMSYNDYIYKIVKEGNNYACSIRNKYMCVLDSLVIPVEYKKLVEQFYGKHINLIQFKDDQKKSCLNCTNQFCDHEQETDEDIECCLLWENNKVKKLEKVGK